MYCIPPKNKNKRESMAQIQNKYQIGVLDPNSYTAYPCEFGESVN